MKKQKQRTEKQLATTKRMHEALKDRAGINARKAYAMDLLRKGVMQQRILEMTRGRFGMGIGVGTLVTLRKQLVREAKRAERSGRRRERSRYNPAAEPSLADEMNPLARKIAVFYIRGLSALEIAQLVIEAQS